MRGVIAVAAIIAIVLLAHITNVAINAFSPVGAAVVLIGTYALPLTVLLAWWQATKRKKREAEEADSKGE